MSAVENVDGIIKIQSPPPLLTPRPTSQCIVAVAKGPDLTPVQKMGLASYLNQLG